MGRWMEKAKAMETRMERYTPMPTTEPRQPTRLGAGSPLVPLPPKFQLGERVVITDNANRAQAGTVETMYWVDEANCAKGWWYAIHYEHGRLSETHESRLKDA